MTETTGSKVKLVYVEDQPDMINLVRAILDKQGYEVIGALGGENGIDTIRSEKPDLVLLDIMMPHMSGWDVFEKMKADEGMENIPVIILTVKAQQYDKVAALYSARVDDYITKPFSPGELIRRVDNVMNSRKRKPT